MIKMITKLPWPVSKNNNNYYYFVDLFFHIIFDFLYEEVIFHLIKAKKFYYM